MDEPIVAGVFGLLGVLVGGLIQFRFSLRSNEEARYLELKSEACADYVNSIAGVAFSLSDDRAMALQAVAAAKGRLCVFGDKDVIEAAVALEKTSRNLAARGESRVARQSARSCCKESDRGAAEAAFLAAEHDPTSSTRLRGRARSRSSDFHHGLLGNEDAQVAFIALMQAMRRRGIAVGEVADRAFKILLLGDHS